MDQIRFGKANAWKAEFWRASRVLAAFLLVAVYLPGQANAQFTDSFDRPDSTTLGNGWIEKTPSAFTIAGQAAAKQASTADYRDLIVYRPAGEDLLDVEASIEFQLTNAQPGYPQLFTRVQGGITAFPGYIDGYILYINDNSTQAVLGRQLGSSFLEGLSTIYLSSALNTTDTYRMRLRTTGTAPVALAAYIERFNGVDWQIIGQANINDNSGARISTAGSVGFGGYVESSYVYDNFVRTDLGAGGSPAPVLTSLTPNSATEGGSPFSLTVQGSDFVAGSIVRWNGADRATTFNSSGELQATITAADIASAGTASVTVFNPAPGGGVSGAQTFTIDADVVNNPAPVLNTLTPNSATEGGSPFSLTVQGSDFVAGSIVRWNGADRATTFNSSGELQATITAADIASAGTASVTVFNPAPGGGVSGAQTFTIDADVVNNPAPVLNTLTPNSATEGGSPFSLTVQGSDFVAGSVVRWNGANRATAFNSSGELQANITAADIASAGTASVTVFNPAPGGGVSGAQTFTIDADVVNNPAPVLNTLTPNSATEGGSSFSLTVQGNDFVADSVVRWNGANRATTFNSSGELQATITAADIASAGTGFVTVFNPAPGGGVSGAQAFTIQSSGPGAPDPILLSLSPENLTTASANRQVTVIGNNLSAQSVVTVNGQSRSTTYVSDQQLTVDLTVADVGASGVLDIAVQTPDAVNQFSRTHPFFVIDQNGSYFFDSFDTSDNATIGNTWTEKNPPAFALSGNAVASTYTAEVYRDNIVYRPASEDRQDVEVGVEFVSQPLGAFTQIHARAQRDTVATPDLLESYILYIEDSLPAPGGMTVAIGPNLQGVGECIIQIVDFPSALQVGERYRLRLRVTGTNPVQLDGRLEIASAGTWQTVVSTIVNHDDLTPPDPYFCGPGFMPPRLTSGGATGISKWTDPADNYDNYYWFDLAGSAPAPSISNVTPDELVQDAPGVTLNVNGGGFVATSIVNWNGDPRPTTYISSTVLQADIPASDLVATGNASITVTTPAPGGGTSNASTVTIVPEGQQSNPVPVLNSVTPGSITAGSPDTVVTISGVGFVAESVVRLNGNDRATVYLSDTSLQATVLASDLQAAGSAAVTVFSPAPGGGESGQQSLIISLPNEFVDNFDRADSADPQNGWIEKNPDAFSIVSGALQKNSVPTDYLDNVMYRPAAESRLNVETSVAFNLTSAAFPGYPQIFARLQSATVATPGWVDGYILYVDNSATRASIGRQLGLYFATSLATINFSEPLNTNDTYRLRLAVTGTSPVQVRGYVERLDTGGSYVTIGQAIVNDNSPDRITGAGVSGIGGFVEQAYSYDDFRDGDL